MAAANQLLILFRIQLAIGVLLIIGVKLAGINVVASA